MHRLNRSGMIALLVAVPPIYILYYTILYYTGDTVGIPSGIPLVNRPFLGSKKFLETAIFQRLFMGNFFYCDFSARHSPRPSLNKAGVGLGTRFYFANPSICIGVFSTILLYFFIALLLYNMLCYLLGLVSIANALRACSLSAITRFCVKCCGVLSSCQS